jgi:hypothetical protein
VGWLILILFVAALVAAVVINRRSSDAARTGVEFDVVGSVADVRQAISIAYCTGAKAQARAFAGGVKVTATGVSTFEGRTRAGDLTEISIVPVDDRLSRVEARATVLFVGAYTKVRFRGTYGRISFAMVNGFCKLFGIAPLAGKVKRFQNGVQPRIERVMVRASAA